MYLGIDPDASCEHGTAWDMHCCGCHGGFLFNVEDCTCVREWENANDLEAALQEDIEMAQKKPRTFEEIYSELNAHVIQLLGDTGKTATLLEELHNVVLGPGKVMIQLTFPEGTQPDDAHTQADIIRESLEDNFAALRTDAVVLDDAIETLDTNILPTKVEVW